MGQIENNNNIYVKPINSIITLNRYKAWISQLKSRNCQTRLKLINKQDTTVNMLLIRKILYKHRSFKQKGRYK